ncbi:monovalent cation/H+ antiporter complex subunit F [Phycisphaera mikurensis]|uniref:Na(+)/H(+) antiporter subunit F n=1 Tax=Phycisphaera mikurensis (strain NBRC 102666 / KCTC 22515 / FYK2301M01) TaxID=1142394 RepID=I0IC27_PHYMF|nr:monovalent cation/H+ antiporter complex subunit F [Phycisphaera mikurensis]MBB6441961.1 multicomponent Na+:H+ antiporter subunit F [Phycisphaera mikurensis]BAM02815.1 Na(+)/H(+) antiporter subunit F [Phycisphaera mikurensis NBRC 102666]
MSALLLLSGGLLGDAAGAGVDAPGLSIHDAAMGVIGVAMVLAVVRLLRGPSLADRVVALDLLAFFSVGLVALIAVVSERAELVIVAVVVALLTFMGTAAFALYLERKGNENAG